MKKIFALCLIGCCCFYSQAQINKNVPPQSFIYPEINLNPLEEILLPEFNLEEARKMDIEDSKAGVLPKFSRSIFTEINLTNSGEWTELTNGSRVWRVKVVSKGAQALLPYFNQFYLPLHATLHVYSENREQVNGAFTSINNPTEGYYATGLIHGESFIVEYYEPSEAKGKGVISLNEIGHAYRWVNDYFPKRSKAQNDTLGFNQSDGCEINVNCSEGANWQDQKRSVVCIIVKSSFGQGICSGSMINNARQDCTPYILSAQHCSMGANINHLNQWLFYFNYESADCTSPFAIGTLGDNFIGGCSKIADSDDNGGDNGSDFILLQLYNAPPESYNVFYSGWSNTEVPANSGVTIHHPGGDIKKISTYNQTLANTSWGLAVDSTHWIVQWVSTTNGHGVTEVGSSGAPLYNEQKQIVGTLTGGDSFCNNPNAPDQYGKFSFDWNRNGNNNNQQLKPWLDPDNTGLTSLNGKNADCTTGITPVTLLQSSFIVFPNPSSTALFNLEFERSENRNISVIDVLGRSILQLKSSEKILQLSLSTQSKGVYILFVEENNERKQLRLIVD